METNTKDFAKLKKKISELNSHKLFEEGENRGIWNIILCGLGTSIALQNFHQDIHGCQVNTQRR